LTELKFIARRILQCRRNSRLRVFFVDRFKTNAKLLHVGHPRLPGPHGQAGFAGGRYADLPQASLKAPLHVLNPLLAANIEVVDPVVACFEADCN